VATEAPAPAPTTTVATEAPVTAAATTTALPAVETTATTVPSVPAQYTVHKEKNIPSIHLKIIILFYSNFQTVGARKPLRLQNAGTLSLPAGLHPLLPLFRN
jgi:hypothetical protein